ncbi:MAG: hypothetical protein AAF990_25790 [Bacteroidota bacterium]
MKNYEEVLKVKEQVQHDLFQIEGVTGVDIGRNTEDANDSKEEYYLKIFVRSRAEILTKQLIPQSIQGISTQVVERTFKLNN